MARPRVLVVDDNRDFADALVDLLELEGCWAEAAYGGEEALHKVETSTYDLVLVDIIMPGKSGVETVRDIRERSAAQVVVMTAYSDQSVIEQVARTARTPVLQKPFEIGTLLQLLPHPDGCDGGD